MFQTGKLFFEPTTFVPLINFFEKDYVSTKACLTWHKYIS